jgi:hypothetical protein
MMIRLGICLTFAVGMLAFMQEPVQAAVNVLAATIR